LHWKDCDPLLTGIIGNTNRSGRMLKTVLAGIAALSISGASLAHAQATSQATPPSTPSADAQQRWRPSAEDNAALVDARVAALKAGLKLTTEQEKHWPAVETAIRDLAKQRTDRMQARRAARGDASTPRQRPDAVERLRRGADAMTARGTALKQLADAVEPLYKTLDQSQKQRFSLLMRMGRGHPHGWRQRG
jgi:zinc resistance-associated protein